MLELFTGLTILLVALTLLPLWRGEAWWIRGLDFPRLQLIAFALVLLLAGVGLLDRSRPSTWMLLCAIIGCLTYQGWWIFPYTWIYPEEVDAAADTSAERRLRILAVNVLRRNHNAEALLAIVSTAAPDVLIAVETDHWWQAHLDRLEPEYPFNLKCPLDNLYGMHLYSRLPLEDARVQFLVEPQIPSMHTLVVLRCGERVRLHCLHPAPPSPTENSESTERDAELIIVGKSVSGARLPVVVAGDLNDVAWSETTRLFRKISGLLDPRVGRGMFNTFHARFPFMRWPLDHLFHSSHFRLVQIHRLRAFGSDHFPILVELQLHSVEGQSTPALDADTDDKAWAEEKIRAENVEEVDVHTPGENISA